ncbi:MAG: agmatinase [Eubacteriales bacterium]
MSNSKDTNEQSLFACEYEKSDIVILGAPFDGTVSYRPGTRFGPQAIRQELYGLESYSPYLDRDLDDMWIGDIGDADMPLGNTAGALKAIGEKAEKALKDGKRVVTLGGEHLVSLPVLVAYAKQYPELVVIQLDAHADLRDSFCGEKLSHACVMRRVQGFLGDGRIYQFGIRSGTKAEFEFAKDHTRMHPFNLKGIPEAVKAIGDKPVYLTIDLDVLDPSILSGTGTPEPGGVSFRELQAGLGEMAGLNIVGADVVELSPHYDASGVSTAAACKVLRETLLIMKK